MAKYRPLVNCNFDSKFITVGVIDSNSASGVVVHSLRESHNPFLYAKFSHGTPDDFSWYTIERLFKVNKCEEQFLVLSKMFFCQSMNIASVVPRPGMKPNCMSSIEILSLMIFSITLSIPFMT